MKTSDFYIVFVSVFLGSLLLFVGCSLSYKPEVKDSEIYHQSGNKPKTDVVLEMKR